MYMIIDITSFCHINWEVVAFKLFVLETVLSGSSLQAQGPFWHFVKVFELYLNYLKKGTLGNVPFYLSDNAAMREGVLNSLQVV